MVCGSAPLSQLTVLPALTAPLRSAPSSALPENSSQGLVSGKNPSMFENFESKLLYKYIIIIYKILL